MPLWIRVQRINLVVGGSMLAVLAATLLVILLSPTFQDCVMAAHRFGGAPNIAIAFSQFFDTHWLCAESFLGDHAEAMAGFAVIVLAFSALGLWLLTAWVGEAKPFGSVRSRGGNAPSLGIKKIGLVSLPSGTDPQSETYGIELLLKNFGRNEVTITRIATGHAIAAGPHHDPLYRYFYQPPEKMVIEKGEERSVRIPDQTLVITPAQRNQIEIGIVHPWLWGEIRYDDPARGAMEWGFVAFQEKGLRVGSQALTEAAWRLRGPQAYAYSRRVSRG